MPTAFHMSRKLQFDDQTILQIITDYHNGSSPQAIGKTIGRSADTIRRVLRENGVTLRGRSDVGRGRSPTNRRVFNSAELEQLQDLHAQGRTLKQIGSEFGVSAPTIRKRLKELGVSTARKRALTKTQRAQVRRRYKKGENVRPLAEAFGV
jgi:transposase